MHSCSAALAFVWFLRDFSEGDFCLIPSYFLNSILKMFCNFLLEVNMAKHRQDCLALLSLKPRKQIKWRKTKFTFTCSFQKAIMVFTISGCEKFGDLLIYYFSFLRIVSYGLIASSTGFNLRWGFRYPQLKLGALHRLYARHPWRHMATFRSNWDIQKMQFKPPIMYTF